MKTYAALLASVVLIFGCSGLATASNTANHTVTVHVDAINEVAITGGDITLTINSANAGSQPNDATNATCHLEWTTNEANKKITVQSDQAAPTFTLKVLATGVSGGTAAPQVTVSNVAEDSSRAWQPPWATVRSVTRRRPRRPKAPAKTFTW